MVQTILYLDEEQDDKIKELHKKWKLSKMEVIRRIIDEYK